MLGVGFAWARGALPLALQWWPREKVKSMVVSIFIIFRGCNNAVGSMHGGGALRISGK
jgi:hypothetical protein